jgi:RNA polymerase-binding transcription factor DksA
MKKAELKPFKQQLQSLRARLVGDVNGLADATLGKTRSESSGDLSSMPIHMADLGSDNFEQEFSLALMEGDEDILREIDAALERIETGTYGICEESGKRITKARLRAIPYTRYCVEIAEKMENGRRE